jgi:soluble lytic murein transglycosylase-like protein
MPPNFKNTTTGSPLLNAGAQRTVDRQSLDQMVNGAGQRHQIDPDFINSVIRAESGYNNRAVSKKGAQGLMQLMPRTASQLGVANSFDPNANVEGGTKYLRELLEKYNYDVPKALAAYNAGSRRVDQYHGVPPYFETQTYVAKIIRDYNRKKLAQNPSLAHKAKTRASHSQPAKAAPPKSQLLKTAAEKPLAGTESASR